MRFQRRWQVQAAQSESSLAMASDNIWGRWWTICPSAFEKDSQRQSQALKLRWVFKPKIPKHQVTTRHSLVLNWIRDLWNNFYFLDLFFWTVFSAWVTLCNTGSHLFCFAAISQWLKYSVKTNRFGHKTLSKTGRGSGEGSVRSVFGLYAQLSKSHINFIAVLRILERNQCDF